ncbi:hypothetical protein EON63_17805 [archaeon]|nr:MAG: hypothetical protein EON63_17805 [archaeon]
MCIHKYKYVYVYGNLPCLTFSTKVNLSSPRVSSRTLPAQPRVYIVYDVWCMVYGAWCLVHSVWLCNIPSTEGSRSSTLFTGEPPQARVSLYVYENGKMLRVGGTCMCRVYVLCEYVCVSVCVCMA